jgi:hypothetical protein
MRPKNSTMASTKSRPRHAGIQVWHRSGCASRSGRTCNCRPAYRAEVWSARDEKKIRKTFTSLVEAKAWRADALGELRRGSLRAPSAMTLADVADTWLAGAGDGSIRNRSGHVYKPCALPAQGHAAGGDRPGDRARSRRRRHALSDGHAPADRDGCR